MIEKKELKSHVEAIGEWASQDSNRVAFVVCGELNENGSSTANSLVGRDDKIARVLFGNAMECENYKRVLELTAMMIKNPLLAQIVASKISDEISGKEHADGDRPLKDAIKNLLDAIMDRIKK